MGMCKGCNGIFNSNEMTNGYCSTCYDGFKDNKDKCRECNQEFTIVELDNGICKQCSKAIKERESQNTNIILSIIVVVLLLIGGYFIYNIYNMKSKPSQEIVKKIALQYDYRFSDVNIVDYYKKDGKVIYILEVNNNMICEMPMIEVRNNWTATGINCKGGY